MGQAIEKLQDEHHIKQRRDELQLYINAFANQLISIAMLARPHIVINMKTGEFTHNLDEEWQGKLDKLKAQQMEFLVKNFPEFYSESK
jgi:hypothetical protein